MPPEIEEVRDYELPYWVREEDSEPETEWEDEPEENGMGEDGAHLHHLDGANDIDWEDGAGDEYDIPPESED